MDNTEIIDKYKALKYKIKLEKKLNNEPTRGTNATKSNKNLPGYEQEALNKYKTLKYKHKLHNVQ